MQAMPHHYQVSSCSCSEGNLSCSSKGLADLNLDAPAEFGGPGDLWSPETLMMSSVSSCFILSFKAIARFSKLSWKSIECESVGRLDRVERVTRFIEITNKVKLVIDSSTSQEKALKLLEKAEALCLVTNSLNSKLKLECEIIIED